MGTLNPEGVDAASAHGEGHILTLAEPCLRFAGRRQVDLAVTAPSRDCNPAGVGDTAAIHRASIEHPRLVAQLLRLAEGLFVSRCTEQIEVAGSAEGVAEHDVQRAVAGEGRRGMAALANRSIG